MELFCTITKRKKIPFQLSVETHDVIMHKQIVLVVNRRFKIMVIEELTIKSMCLSTKMIY